MKAANLLAVLTLVGCASCAEGSAHGEWTAPGASPEQTIEPRAPRRLAMGAGFVCVVRAGAVRCGGELPWDLERGSREVVALDVGQEVVEVAADGGSTLCMRTAEGHVLCRSSGEPHARRWELGDARRIAVDEEAIFVWREGPVLSELSISSLDEQARLDGFDATADLAATYGIVCGVGARGELSCVNSSDDWQSWRWEDAFAEVGFDGEWLRARTPEGDVLEGSVLGQPTSIPLDSTSQHGVRSLQGACVIERDDRIRCPHRPDRAWTILPDATIDARPLEVARDFSTGCVLDDRERLLCWGNDGGALGIERDGMIVSDVLGVEDARSLSIGWRSQGEHVCALTGGGAVWCWGAGYSARPKRIEGLAQLGADVVAIASSDVTDCALASNGRVACWGRRHAALGERVAAGSDEPVLLPLTILDLAGVEEIAASIEEVCARTSSRVLCWGERPPREIPSLAGATHLAGSSYYLCGVVDVELRCEWLPESPDDEGSNPAPSARRTVGAIDALGGGVGAVCWRREGAWECVRDDATTPLPPGTASASFESWRACVVSGADVLCSGVDPSGAMADDRDLGRFVPQAWLGAAREVVIGANIGCVITQERRVRCWLSTHDPALGSGQSVAWETPRVIDE